jgi:hypothetical protein
MGTAESDNQKALACVHIEFRLRVADLRNATRQLVVTQSENKDTAVADLLVTESVATFRTALASTDVPVNGIHTGAARLPIPTLKKIVTIAATYKRKEILILIWTVRSRLAVLRLGMRGLRLAHCLTKALTHPLAHLFLIPSRSLGFSRRPVSKNMDSQDEWRRRKGQKRTRLIGRRWRLIRYEFRGR